MGNCASANKKIPQETLQQLRKCTAFSDDELQNWYKGFQKDCPKGKMTEKEFESMYNNFFKDGDASKFARHVFRTFDKDGSHSIDFGEFMMGLSMTCHGRKEDKLRWAFNMCDIDNSGTITESELTEIVRALSSMMRNDDDGDTGDNFDDEEDSPEAISERLFLSMDIDGDGEITADEFVEAAKDDQTILKLLQQK